MARIAANLPLVPSLLDRLMDFEPDLSREAPRSRTQVLRAIKRGVRRDLENLLNTRVRCVPSPPGLKEIAQSLVSYGIPDLSAASLGTAKERQDFCDVLRSVINLFDRRLKRVNIRLLDEGETLDRTVRFHIDAVLHVEPAPEPLSFDSSFHLSTAAFEVKGETDE